MALSPSTFLHALSSLLYELVNHVLHLIEVPVSSVDFSLLLSLSPSKGDGGDELA